jgi:predicted esterase
MGFSGGALFTTIVASQRGDTLAAIVEMSGGSDLEVSLAEGEVASYDTPAYTMPALLATGGTNDVWPSPDFPIVDFVAGTDTLEASLVADGHYTVRCRHERGHTITNAELELAVEWVSVHRFEEPSPYLSSGLGSDEDWCVVASE